MKKTRLAQRILAALFVFALSCTTVWTKPIVIQKQFLPEITTLSGRIPIPNAKPARSELNYVLKDYNDDVTAAYKALAEGKTALLQFYRYTATGNDTIITLAARCNIPQETLATANGLEVADARLAGKELFLPTVPGLFVAKKPSGAFETLLAAENADALTDETPVYQLAGKEYFFLQGVHISSTTRAFFLDTSMRMPLTEFVLTSSFGGRISPISGKWLNHNGVDLAASTGTPVYACKSGTVQSALKGDPIFGNYVILQHTNGMTSVYAHLSEISVKQGDSIPRGTQLGKVGTTGASTGPHLHFEVRVNGKPTNPLR